MSNLKLPTAAEAEAFVDPTADESEEEEPDESEEEEPDESEEEEPATPEPDDSMFSSPSSLTDVVLVVEGKKLHVSQALLCLASPVFLKMFEGDFKNTTEVPLADKKYADFVEFLLCIHPSTSKPVQRETLDIVLPLADEYEVESLKQRCEQFVLTMFLLKDDTLNNPANEELVHFTYLADKYKLTSLLDECLEKLKYRTYDDIYGVKRFPEFQRLSSDTKLRVLSERLILLESPVCNILGVHMRDLWTKRHTKPTAVHQSGFGTPSASVLFAQPSKPAESVPLEMVKPLDLLKQMFKLDSRFK